MNKQEEFKNLLPEVKDALFDIILNKEKRDMFLNFINEPYMWRYNVNEQLQLFKQDLHLVKTYDDFINEGRQVKKNEKSVGLIKSKSTNKRLFTLDQTFIKNKNYDDNLKNIYEKTKEIDISTQSEYIYNAIIKTMRENPNFNNDDIKKTLSNDYVHEGFYNMLCISNERIYNESLNKIKEYKEKNRKEEADTIDLNKINSDFNEEYNSCLEKIGTLSDKDKKETFIEIYKKAPNTLRMIGVDKDAKIKISYSAIEHIDKHFDKETKENIIKQIPSIISNPVCILYGSQVDSLVFISEIKINDNNILLPLQLDKRTGDWTIYKVPTIYERTNTEYYLEKEFIKHNVIAFNQEKMKLFRDLYDRLSLPKRDECFIYDDSIAQKLETVKDRLIKPFTWETYTYDLKPVGKITRSEIEKVLKLKDGESYNISNDDLLKNENIKLYENYINNKVVETKNYYKSIGKYKEVVKTPKYNSLIEKGLTSRERQKLADICGHEHFDKETNNKIIGYYCIIADDKERFLNALETESNTKIKSFFEKNIPLVLKDEAYIEKEEKPEKNKAIKDFGEKIGGAKKDLWTERGLLTDDLNEMNLKEQSKYVVKANIWKKPDYKELVKNGTPKEVAYFYKTIIDSLPTTISHKYNATEEEIRNNNKKFINFVNKIKDLTYNCKTIDDCKNFSKVIDDAILIKKNYIYSLKEEFSNINVNKLLKVASRWDWNQNGMIRDMQRKSFLEEKDKNNVKNSSYKKRFKYTPLSQIKRIAEEKYLNKDAEGNDFLKDFNLKGGEFGNWESDKERQENLNLAYDSFKDIAKALKINDKDVSFDGKLSIAFGSRGSGNALAHYEPMRKVINLTKLKGAGCLAHEYGHFLDNMLSEHTYGENLEKTTYLSEQSKFAITPKENDLKSAYKELVNSMKEKLATDKEKEEYKTEKLNSIKNSLLTHYLNTYGNYDLYQRLEGCFRSNEEDALKELELIKDFAVEEEKTQFRDQNLKKFASDIVRNIPYIEGKIKRFYALKNDPLNNFTIDTDYYKLSKKMDDNYSKMGHGYWSSECEMFARAFDCYINDKLAQMGIYNTYLTGHCEVVAPIGKEREEINKRFDKVFNIAREMVYKKENTVNKGTEYDIDTINKGFDNLANEIDQKGTEYDLTETNEKFDKLVNDIETYNKSNSIDNESLSDETRNLISDFMKSRGQEPKKDLHEEAKDVRAKIEESIKSDNKFTYKREMPQKNKFKDNNKSL